MDKICSVQLCLGLLTVFSIMLLIPSAHGKPLALQGNSFSWGFQEAVQIFTLPVFFLPDLELAKKFEELEQLEKLKEQLLAGEGSEEAYAEAGLLPSHPDKRACFWKYCV
uniref:Urotensin 2B n=1 Tax=Terrapene triunguis TaxID=2587831 RepID=A0A674I024_9SAUR